MAMDLPTWEILPGTEQLSTPDHSCGEETVDEDVPRKRQKRVSKKEKPVKKKRKPSYTRASFPDALDSDSDLPEVNTVLDGILAKKKTKDTSSSKKSKSSRSLPEAKPVSRVLPPHELKPKTYKPKSIKTPTKNLGTIDIADSDGDLAAQKKVTSAPLSKDANFILISSDDEFDPCDPVASSSRVVLEPARNKSTSQCPRYLATDTDATLSDDLEKPLGSCHDKIENRPRHPQPQPRLEAKGTTMFFARMLFRVAQTHHRTLPCECSSTVANFVVSRGIGWSWKTDEQNSEMKQEEDPPSKLSELPETPKTEVSDGWELGYP
ncbi:hypothetical protein C8J56DRAFT_1044182 [Mycena floridula]|nr:hypothetical protein C8J56DRAFT_1044182 [Mycena floridula]